MLLLEVLVSPAVFQNIDPYTSSLDPYTLSLVYLLLNCAHHCIIVVLSVVCNIYLICIILVYCCTLTAVVVNFLSCGKSSVSSALVIFVVLVVRELGSCPDYRQILKVEQSAAAVVFCPMAGFHLH